MFLPDSPLSTITGLAASMFSCQENLSQVQYLPCQFYEIFLKNLQTFIVVFSLSAGTSKVNTTQTDLFCKKKKPM